MMFGKIATSRLKTVAPRIFQASSVAFVLISGLLIITWVDAFPQERAHCNMNCTPEIEEAMGCENDKVLHCDPGFYVGKRICGCCNECLEYLEPGSVCLDGGVDVNTPLGVCSPGFVCISKKGTCVEEKSKSR